MPTTGAAVVGWLGTSGVAAAAATAAVGALATKALAPKPQDQAKPPLPLGSADKPQDVQAPERSNLKQQNALAAAAAGSLSGNSSTLLTGSSGASGGLNLGTNTLLGS